jgi:hypothetical protein
MKKRERLNVCQAIEAPSSFSVHEALLYTVDALLTLSDDQGRK